jgi:hypothetical protein
MTLLRHNASEIQGKVMYCAILHKYARNETAAWFRVVPSNSNHGSRSTLLPKLGPQN